MHIMKKTARYFAKKNYCKTAIATRADLSIFQEKPTPSMVIGILMIFLSYVIGLPAVVFMAAVSMWAKKPLIGIIGGPLIYGISTVVFIVGIKMAGAKHIKALFAWITRVLLEKILGDEINKIGDMKQETAETGESK